MKWSLPALLIVSLLFLPAAAPALSISGIMIYSTDDFGNPSGWDDVTQQYVHGQLWRTRLGGIWYGLGLLSGLPLQSLAGLPLNAPDFSVEIPLVEGENDFTLVGEPGPLTETDSYERFALNLYFDGMLDHPGISVLFPRRASRGGDPPTPNRSETLYALSLAPVQVAPETTYSDGTDTVSVTAVTFLPPQSFGADVDLVSPEAPVANGNSDWIGVLKINVEGPPPAPAPYAPVPPSAFGVMPGRAIVGPDVLGAPQPRNPGNQEPAPMGDSQEAAIASAEPTAEGPTPHETVASPAPGTSTPAAPTMGSPTAPPQTSATPGTPSHTTATPGSTGTAHTVTPAAGSARPAATATPPAASKKDTRKKEQK